MIYLLDTNVLSEQTKRHPSPKVMSFLRKVPAADARVPAIVLGEIKQGVQSNPTPALRQFLEVAKANRFSLAAYVRQRIGFEPCACFSGREIASDESLVLLVILNRPWPAPSCRRDPVGRSKAP